jgi:hypothetical protein
MFRNKYLKYKSKYDKLKKFYQEGGDMHNLYQFLGIKNIINSINLIIQDNSLSSQ